MSECRIGAGAFPDLVPIPTLEGFLYRGVMLPAWYVDSARKAVTATVPSMDRAVARDILANAEPVYS